MSRRCHRVSDQESDQICGTRSGSLRSGGRQRRSDGSRNLPVTLYFHRDPTLGTAHLEYERSRRAACHHFRTSRLVEAVWIRRMRHGSVPPSSAFGELSKKAISIFKTPKTCYHYPFLYDNADDTIGRHTSQPRTTRGGLERMGFRPIHQESRNSPRCGFSGTGTPACALLPQQACRTSTHRRVAHPRNPNRKSGIRIRTNPQKTQPSKNF